MQSEDEYKSFKPGHKWREGQNHLNHGSHDEGEVQWVVETCERDNWV